MLEKLKAAIHVLSATKPAPVAITKLPAPLPLERLAVNMTIPEAPFIGDASIFDISTWPSLNQPKVLKETAPMPARSVLGFLGSDVKKVFQWLGSANGQRVIAAGEEAVESFLPEADGIIAIGNVGLREIIKIESMAVAAAVPSGSGPQKSAAVTSVLTPEILAYAEQHGFPTPTAAKIQAASDALVAFLNAFDATPAA